MKTTDELYEHYTEEYKDIADRIRALEKKNARAIMWRDLGIMSLLGLAIIVVGILVISVPK